MYKPSLFNAQAMIMFVHICLYSHELDVNKLCVNQLWQIRHQNMKEEPSQHHFCLIQPCLLACDLMSSVRPDGILNCVT